MSDPNWKILDVPDVPDPSATQPPTRVDPELLASVGEEVPQAETPEPVERSRLPLVGGVLLLVVALALFALAFLGVVLGLLASS